MIGLPAPARDADLLSRARRTATRGWFVRLMDAPLICNNPAHAGARSREQSGASPPFIRTQCAASTSPGQVPPRLARPSFQPPSGRGPAQRTGTPFDRQHRHSI
ncbi:DUF5953 family protein [Myxococcus xanthus]|uniref:DUF5953 family protein n=1 Tax=Myxococcus xanthus TaxID=34 RepID=UPI0011295562|nr:DUF5953 family protein [Myxococcus xanthus]